jgi:hypothetical protein
MTVQRVAASRRKARFSTASPAAPVATTTARASPDATSVPEYSIDARSPSDAVAPTGAACFYFYLRIQFNVVFLTDIGCLYLCMALSDYYSQVKVNVKLFLKFFMASNKHVADMNHGIIFAT